MLKKTKDFKLHKTKHIFLFKNKTKIRFRLRHILGVRLHAHTSTVSVSKACDKLHILIYHCLILLN